MLDDTPLDTLFSISIETWKILCILSISDCNARRYATGPTLFDISNGLMKREITFPSVPTLTTYSIAKPSKTSFHLH